MITVLCGGVGAARLLRGLVRVVPPTDVHALVNVADDLELHGLHVSPDIDTITYTVAGIIDPDRGWGLVDESWRVLDELRELGGEAWFSLGDRDLATHLYRTQRLAEGATLSEVTAELAARRGLELVLRPISDDPVRTMVTVPDEGEIGFQEYFVGRRHDVAVESIRFSGAEAARPAPGVLEDLAEAEMIVIAPSNPFVSIDPVLAVPGVRDAVAARRDRVVAISPIVGGEAIKGPAGRMLTEMGHEASCVGVARHLAPVAGTLVIDAVDADRAADVEAVGMRAVVTDTIMSTPERAAALGRATLAALGG